MKKDKIIEYIFAIILLCILFFNLFVLNVFNNKYVFAIFLLIYLIICGIFVKGRKIENKNKRNVIILVTALSFVYLLSIYIIGLFSGYYRNSTSFSIKVLLNRIIPISAIVIISELIRYKFLTKDDKKSATMITISLILVDILINIKLYNIFNLEELLALIGYVGLVSISTNLMCNYMVKRYGYMANIIYRIITTMYIYIFPILPDIYMFFQTVLKIIYPYITYLIIDFAYATDNFKMVIKNSKTNFIGLLITIILSIAIVLLVSCKFRYGIMAVGSPSMTGSINKGDAIIFEQYTGQELEEGQVIIFNKENVVTIHRIQDIQILNGDTIYYTKGDYNEQQDKGYRKSEDIIGVVKFRLINIGWPTIWLNEFITN